MSTKRNSSVTARVVLSAALTAAAGLGGYAYTSMQENGGDTPTDTSASAGATSTVAVASFTTADAGSCLTWDNSTGTVSGFEQTDCEAEHRFEVSSREDLSTYPNSEFGANASMPDLTRQAQLREELCLAPTLAYLGGTFDQLGKYSVASILPPQAAWDQGDRTLLCGVQATDEAGHVIATVGKAATQDQSRVYQAGTCVSIDAASATYQVDCGVDHQLETTLIVDLLPVFPQGTPTVEDQDNYLREVCTQAARDYLGGDDPLYYSTLQPFWGTIQANSWTGGSHSVNCSLVFANADNSFGMLNGSAKGAFTINGNPPESRAERAPIVNPEALTAATPAAEPAAVAQ